MVGPSGDLSTLRRNNRLRVLAALREHGPLAQTQLAQKSGLSQASISNIVADSLREGLVTLSEKVDGRRYKIIALSENLGLGLGIGIDHQEIEVVVGNLGSGVLHSGRVRVAVGDAPLKVLEQAARLVEASLAAAGKPTSDVVAIGLSLPSPVSGPMDERLGEPVFPNWWFAHPVDWLRQRLGAPVFLDNHANAAAMAEWRWGAGRGISDLLAVQIGDGIGAGLILNDRLYRGGLGGAGELGHVIVEPDGPRCRCGNFGCLEAVASLPALVAQVASRRPAVTTSALFLDAVMGGDELCMAAMEQAATRIGAVLAIVSNVLSPSRIVVGGPFLQASRLVLPMIRRGLVEGLIPNLLAHPELVPAELDGEARALGALALATRLLPDDALTTPLHAATGASS